MKRRAAHILTIKISEPKMDQQVIENAKSYKKKERN